MNIVEAHYGQPGLEQRIIEALRESGLDPDHLKQSELEKLDHFHVGGVEATNGLAHLAEISEGDRVLDVGSGIGGPSRHLAASLGCHVTGIDLTEEYCQVATMLARATGLANLVDYQKCDALHMPFENESFDVVWTQHAAMNIEDKRGLYREIFRVLKPGGRLAVHDIVAGTGIVRYPVPWATRSDFSFLITADEMKDLLSAEGFQTTSSQDATPQGIEALQQMARSAGTPGFGIRTLMGAEFPTMIANLIANFQNGACRLEMAVFAK